MQPRVAGTVSKTAEGVLGQRDMELALVGTLMDWAGTDQLIPFPNEIFF
jgi:hypothetical protein